MVNGGKSESDIACERYPDLPSRALKKTDLGAIDFGRTPLLLGVRTQKDPVAMPKSGCDCHAFFRGETPRIALLLDRLRNGRHRTSDARQNRIVKNWHVQTDPLPKVGLTAS
jgi:hypothetical protein